MRITKVLAEEVSRKLTAKMQEEVDQLADQIKTKATAIVIAGIPDEVYNLFKKYPRYFDPKGYASFAGNGLNYNHFDLTEDLPIADNCISVNKADGRELVKLSDERSKKTKALRELRSEIVSSLLSLGSFAKIKQAFPEASAYLPENPTSTALVPNLEGLRAKLAY